MPTEVEIADGQLLRSFLATDDQAAFSCLFRRHAPAIYRSALRIVRDRHHAEDVVQASFLVLCQQANSIRQEQSLAGWLHRVTVRIALKLRSETPQLRPLDDEPNSERTELVPKSHELDLQTRLEVELSKLPEKYQTPLVMHYLQGKSATTVAKELRLTYGAVLVRLSRGRDKLRVRCLRDSQTSRAEQVCMLALGSAEPTTALSETLARLTLDTVRLARLGLGVWSTASQGIVMRLAEGITPALVDLELKTTIGFAMALTTVLALSPLFFAGSLATGFETSKPSVNFRTTGSSVRQAKPADESTYQVEGIVQEEGTGLPIEGATLELLSAPGWRGRENDLIKLRTNKQGRFSQLLPAGNYRIWRIEPPIGFTNVPTEHPRDPLVLNETQPKISMNFKVRKGTIWPIALGGEASRSPYQPELVARSKARPTADFRSNIAGGMFGLNLPIDSGGVTVRIERAAPGIEYASLDIDWEQGFRPEAVRSITESKGTVSEYKLVDEANKRATISTSERMEPKVFETGTLLIFLSPMTSKSESSDLAGQVVDETGKPIRNATVSLGFKSRDGASVPTISYRTARTNSEGNYRFLDVPNCVESGEQTTLELAIIAPGSAGIDIPPFQFSPAQNGTHVVKTVRLLQGKTIQGLVLQSNGKPAAGAWVQPTGSSSASKQFTRTDSMGQFTVRDMPAGRVALRFDYGKMRAVADCLVDTDSQRIVVKLKESRD
jgi:RNA polymerase sigma factor (sigma-70 family)